MQSLPPHSSDAALVAAAGRGDRGALELLYQRHVRLLYLRLSRRCADKDLVEEAVQDTFVAVRRRRRLIDHLRRRPPKQAA